MFCTIKFVYYKSFCVRDDIGSYIRTVYHMVSHTPKRGAGGSNPLWDARKHRCKPFFGACSVFCFLLRCSCDDFTKTTQQPHSACKDALFTIWWWIIPRRVWYNIKHTENAGADARHRPGHLAAAIMCRGRTMSAPTFSTQEGRAASIIYRGVYHVYSCNLYNRQFLLWPQSGL